MYTLLALLALPAALAIQVTSPTQETLWDASSSSQTVSWSSVDTDATSFAIVLVNQDRSVLPNNDVLLAPNVSTSLGTTTVTYPGGGSWPVGDAFQVNLIQDSNNINTIYAQSNDFNITAGTSSSTSSSSSTASAASNTGTTLSITNSGASTASNSASALLPGSSASASTGANSTLPNTGSGSSGALGSGVQMGALVFALGLLGAVLA